MARKHTRPPPAACETVPSAVEEMLRRAARAVEEYDYELARGTLEHAFEASNGAEPAARALLELLVDHLGADGEALELGERLPGEVRATAGVRLPLAVAAARCGDHERARVWLGHLEGAPAAGVLVTLAGGRLASGDLDGAVRLCDEARAHDAAHPELQEMQRRIAHKREEVRRPLEEPITRALADGELETARRLAEELLARFPESPVVRRALRAADEGQRSAEARRLVGTAEAALAQPDPGVLRAACRAARTAVTAAPADEALSRRLVALEAEVSAREVDVVVEEIKRLLTAGDRRVCLTRYAALAPDVRRQVRERAGALMFVELEQMLGKRVDVDEAVEALLAHREATVIGERDPEGALRRLATHERTLTSLGSASRLASWLRQRIRDDLRRRHAELLTAARAAFERGDADGALEILGHLRELDPKDREVAEALRTSARGLLETRELEATYERLLQAADPLAAREAAERLLARATDAERAACEARITAATAAARRAFGVWACVADSREGPRDSTATVELEVPFDISASQEDTLPWIDAEKRSLVLLECCDRWLFLHIVDLAAGRVDARAVLRTPEPLATPVAAISPEHTLTIAGGAGAVLELELETWAPISWRSSREIASAAIVDDMQIAPGGRFVWINARRSDDTGRIRVVDLRRGRVTREVSAGWWFRPVAGAEEPMMASSRSETMLSLHQPNGTPLDGGRFELPASIYNAVVHPLGWQLLVFVGDDDARLGHVEVDRAGGVSATRWIEDIDPVRPWAVASSLAHRTGFVCGQDCDGQPSLWALHKDAVSGSMATLYRARLQAPAWLARDRSSRDVWALVPDHERLHVVPLGADTPKFPDCTPGPARWRLPDLGHGECRRVGRAPPGYHDNIARLRHQPERATTAWMQQQLTTHDRSGILYVYDALCAAGQAKVADDLLRWMTEKRPADPHTALAQAEAHAGAERWAEVRDVLESIDLLDIVVERRQHAYHLLGLALLHLGEFARAATVVEEGLGASAGNCCLAELLEVVEPLPESLGDLPEPLSPIRGLRAAIHLADAALLRGDIPRMRAALDVRSVWMSEEVQALARLAEAELRGEPASDIGRFRKALALARFLDAQRRLPALRRELPLAEARWPAAQIAEVERQAQAWLERLGAPPESPPIAPPAPWSLALQELDAALDAIAAEPSASARLAFRIRHTGRRFEAIDPLLQRSLRGGRFSPGQVVDAGDLVAVSDLLGDDADAAALAALTDGVAPRVRSSPSRTRVRRLLGTLVGHPRVFLADRPGEPVAVRRGRIAVELVADELQFIVGGGRWKADELLAQADASLVIDVDADAQTVTLARLGAETRALARALEHHRPVFPSESHGALLRRLDRLQQEVDLRVPETLVGEAREADGRPVVRLTPESDTELLVELGVRPLPGARFGPPGAGAIQVLGAADGRRVSARRDLAGERSAAERVMSRLPLEGATRETQWRHRVVGEAGILAVVEALAEAGPEVMVEWPEDARGWRRIGKATGKELRVRVTHANDLLGVEGCVEVEGHRVAIEELLAVIREGRSYVVVGPWMFIALAEDLRERLAAAADLLFLGRGGLSAGLAAAPALAELEGAQPAADAAWARLREQVTQVRDLDHEPPADLRAELRPYQREGFRWLARLAAWGAGACLADDMGLGKTLQALALLVHRAGKGPALVIAPTSVTPNWLAEATRFAPALRARPYRGPYRSALLAEARPGDVLVAGYGVVARDVDALSAVCFSTLVLDEAQALKNAASRRTRAVQRLRADFRVALTGTPVENHLGELWSLFHVLSPGLLGTWPQFRDRFAAPIERDRSAPQRAALTRVLRPFLLRRTKEAVLPELPPRIEVTRLVNLSAGEQERYETARLAAAAAIAEATDPRERFAILGWLTRLRRLACHPRLLDAAWGGAASKLDAFLAIVDELREAGHRALVFSQFTDHLAIVREALAARGVSVQYLDGSTPVDERARAVDAFQSGAGGLFLISLKAGGTGLNLTAADHVIHLDPWWNPAVEDQATDRAHRIGQSRSVTVIRLIARGTIEEAVVALHAEKRDLAECLLAGADIVGRMSTNALVDLVRRGAGTTDIDDEDTDPDHADTGPV